MGQATVGLGNKVTVVNSCSQKFQKSSYHENIDKRDKGKQNLGKMLQTEGSQQEEET